MIERVFPNGGLSLTPTLSRWERERVSQSAQTRGRLDHSRRRHRFSLSQRERVGVREKPSFLRAHWILSRNSPIALRDRRRVV